MPKMPRLPALVKKLKMSSSRAMADAVRSGFCPSSRKDFMVLRCTEIALNQRLIVEQIGHRACGDGLPIIDNHESICKSARDTEILLDEQDCHLRRQLVNRVHQMFDHDGSQPF